MMSLKLDNNCQICRISYCRCPCVMVHSAQSSFLSLVLNMALACECDDVLYMYLFEHVIV